MPPSLPYLRNSPLQWIAATILTSALVASVSIPNLMRARISASQAALMAQYRNATSFASNDQPIRKTIRSGAMDLLVNSPTDTAERLRELAERTGGYLVSSEVRGGAGTQSASLTIRVPESRFDEAHTEIRKLGLRVEGEHFEALDVTTKYVDTSARLRNLRAQEEQ
jgi:Domain of unknown function (DUF4349)